MEGKASTSIREQVIFLSYKGRSFDLNLKHGHTWKLRKCIYSNTIFINSKEDSDGKIKA